MPESEDEWNKELKGFIENYEFPCVGAWDGFHVYISSKLKSFYNFKHLVSNMALVGYKKRFLDQVVGAPGSTHQVGCSLFETYRIVPKDNGRSGASKQNSRIR